MRVRSEGGFSSVWKTRPIQYASPAACANRPWGSGWVEGAAVAGAEVAGAAPAIGSNAINAKTVTMTRALALIAAILIDLNLFANARLGGEANGTFLGDTFVLQRHVAQRKRH